MADDLRSAIRALGPDAAPAREFVPKPASPIPDSAGKGANALPKSGQSAGGDMAETRFADRTYHPRQTLKSTDGIITWLFDPIKSVQMADGAGKSVTWTFAEPTL